MHVVGEGHRGVPELPYAIAGIQAPRKPDLDHVRAERADIGNEVDRLGAVRLRDFGPTDTARAVCELTPGGCRMRKQPLAWTVRTATGSTTAVRVLVDDRVFYREQASTEPTTRVLCLWRLVRELVLHVRLPREVDASVSVGFPTT